MVRCLKFRISLKIKKLCSSNFLLPTPHDVFLLPRYLFPRVRGSLFRGLAQECLPRVGAKCPENKITKNDKNFMKSTDFCTKIVTNRLKNVIFCCLVPTRSASRSFLSALSRCSAPRTSRARTLRVGPNCRGKKS